MTLIVAAPVLPHTERQHEEAKANVGAGRTGTPRLSSEQTSIGKFTANIFGRRR
jgi:hypothetical protein